MQEDSKKVLKVVKMPNDMKCIIIKKTHSEEEFYFEDVSYCYEHCDSLEYKISIACFSDEDGDEYSVTIDHPKEEALISNVRTESEALTVLNSHLWFPDKVPALGWNMSLR